MRVMSARSKICGALARQLRVPYINLKQFSLNQALVQTLSEAQARRFRAIVLDDDGSGDGGTLRIGLADPTDLFAYDELSRLLKRELTIAVVAESQLMENIDRMYRRTGEISALSRELTAELAQTEADYGTTVSSDAALKDAPVVKLLQTLFEDAAQVRASDIHIEPQERNLHVRFRIDGLLHLQTEADSKIAPALVLRLKLMSGLDISEKRLPQDGRFHVDIRGNALDVRISTMPTQYGESVVMRLLTQNTGLLANRSSGHARTDADTGAACARTCGRHDPGDRPDRQRQDHHALRRAGRHQCERPQDHHGGRPGRIPFARRQPRCRCTRRSSSVSSACCARRCGKIRM